jgi:hypothetical protein
MKTMTGRLYSFSQLTQYTMLNNVLDPLPSNINGFIRRTTVFLLSFERRYLAQSLCFSPRITLRCRPYSYNQLTEFRMLNKVLGPLACNIYGSLRRETVLLPFTCKWLFEKSNVPHSVKPERQAVFPWKVHSLLTGKQHASPPCF